MSGWLLAKYVLTLGGVALVLLGDRVGLRWVSIAGLAVLIAAFSLRFIQRRMTAARQ